MSQCPPNCVNRCCWNAKQRAHALQACADAGLDLGSVGVADRALVAYARAALAEKLALCESPAEEAMLAGFAALGVAVEQQVEIGAYRLDFAFVDARVAVEVDGHAFHDRTPEQAQRDRARDRELVARGWTPLRFTAREVFADAPGCTRQVAAILEGKAA